MLEKDKSVLLSQPFVRFAPFFAAGMLTAYFGGELWSAGFLAAAFAAFIFAAFRVKAKKPARFCLCAAGAVCGIVLMSAYSAFYVKPVARYAGETVSTKIFVDEIVSKSGQSEKIIAKATLGGKQVKLRLTCDQSLPEGYEADVTIEFDAADYNNAVDNLSRGIYLTGEITEINALKYKGTGAAGFFRMLRRNFSGRLSENVFGDSADMALAMLYGESGKLSPQYYEYLRVSGAAHYTAVSGAHFTVLAAAILSLLPQSRRRLRLWASLMFAPAAVLFFGISPSVLRASVMFFVYALGMLMYRRANPLNSLCVAVTVIPLFSPCTILDAGFAMSVLGVFGVGVVGPALAEKLRDFIPEKARNVLEPIVTALSCSVCAVICTAPISAALFKCVSAASVITSLLLAPLMALAMMFALLLGFTGLRFFALPVDWSMKVACFIVKTFGKLRFTVISLDYKGAWIGSAVLAAVMFLCAFGTLKTFSRFIKIAGAFLLVIPLISAVICQNRREIYFTGNTYTSAAVIIEKNTACVYIAGGGDGLSERISRIMRERGAYRITELYAAEADYGGALAIKSLSEMLTIERVSSNALAAGLLTERDVARTEENALFSAAGVTLATANADNCPAADIALYTGSMKKVTESPAGLAVYFAKTEYDLPDNFRSAGVERTFRVRLEQLCSTYRNTIHPWER